MIRDSNIRKRICLALLTRQGSAKVEELRILRAYSVVEAITIKLFFPRTSSILGSRIESERSDQHIEDAAIEEETKLAKGIQEISQEDYETYDTEARGVDQADRS